MTHASLFSGIGGCEVAAAMLGWENVFHCEINPFGRAVLEYWFPNSKSYEDITKTSFKEWRGKIDVLTGGFPCQPFSYAGQRRGAEDDRYLWPQMLRAISEIRPTWVIGENVAGITTMVEPGEIVEVGVQTDLFGAEDSLHTYEYRQRYTLERVCADLESLGYSVQPIIIPACAVGAPHRRDRIFILAEDTMRLGLQERDGIGQYSFIERTPGAESRTRRSGLLGAALGLLASACEDSQNVMGGGQFLITPTSSDGMRSNYSLEALRDHDKPNAEMSNLAEQLAHICSTDGEGSRLNPQFTEEMMGFPLMWTALPFLSTNGGKKHSKPTETR